MRRLTRLVPSALCVLLAAAPAAFASEFAASPSAVTLPVGARASVKVTGASGPVRVTAVAPAIVAAAYENTLTVTGLKAGDTTVNVRDRSRTVTVAVKVIDGPATPPSGASTEAWRVLASRDLGLQCADLE